MGCEQQYIYRYTTSSKAVAENLATLEKGMSTEEVLLILGTPHETYADEFGQDTGSPWEGEVWLYFTGTDKSMEWVKRYQKTMLVFNCNTSASKLVHWQQD